MLVEEFAMKANSRKSELNQMLGRLEAHRPGERAHAERVAVYAVATGYRLGLRDEELMSLKEAALLHDIGKLTIDANLLRKESFDQEDRAAAQLHTILFVKTMPSHDWLDRLGPLIRGHHERWDGAGYPDGLQENEIPLAARIIAVAEVFDTGLTGAGWAAPNTEESMLDRIRAGSGKSFDPEVVRAFLEVQPLIQPL